ncbi:MAG TPA: hypothetical protein VF534_21830 [Paraburkholderia sp.]
MPVFKLSIEESRLGKKAGIECKKWAKVVPWRVDAVQNGTGMGVGGSDRHRHAIESAPRITHKGTSNVHDRFVSGGVTQRRAKVSICFTFNSKS